MPHVTEHDGYEYDKTLGNDGMQAKQLYQQGKSHCANGSRNAVNDIDLEILLHDVPFGFEHKISIDKEGISDCNHISNNRN